jgi:thiol-disulfide isomerase/thioredoxin
VKISSALRYAIAWLGFVAMGYGLTLMFVDRPNDDRSQQTPVGAPTADNTDAGILDAINVNDIDIALASLGGDDKALSTWQGKPLVVNFWATWCAPCRKEIPLLKALQDEYADEELTIVGIAIDEMDAVAGYAEDAQFNYPILVGEESGYRMASAIGVKNFYVPITAFVDRRGRVRRIHTGEVHREDAEMAIAEIVAR